LLQALPHAKISNVSESAFNFEETPEFDTDPSWPPWAVGVIECMQAEPNISKAAKHMGIHRSTINRWRQRSSSFDQAMSEAHDSALDAMEEACRSFALGLMQKTKTVVTQLPDGGVQTVTTTEFVHSPTLLIFYLKRWRNEYRDNHRAEPIDPDHGTIEIEERLRDAPREFRARVLRLVESGRAEVASDSAGDGSPT
jgi:transposase-like protein